MENRVLSKRSSLQYSELEYPLYLLFLSRSLHALLSSVTNSFLESAAPSHMNGTSSATPRSGPHVCPCMCCFEHALRDLLRHTTPGEGYPSYGTKAPALLFTRCVWTSETQFLRTLKAEALELALTHFTKVLWGSHETEVLSKLSVSFHYENCFMCTWLVSLAN